MLRRTQFDELLLRESHLAGEVVATNAARQVVVDGQGVVWTGLVFAGEHAMLRVWRGREIVAEHALGGAAGAVSLVDGGGESPEVWVSVEGCLHHAPNVRTAPAKHGEMTGVVQDAVRLQSGGVVLAVGRGEAFYLVHELNGRRAEHLLADGGAMQASLDVDVAGDVHVAFARGYAIEYRQMRVEGGAWREVVSERAALPLGSWPVVCSHEGQVLIAYLGETYPRPAGDEVFWKERGNERRLGLGGYIALLVRDSAEMRAAEAVAPMEGVGSPDRPSPCPLPEGEGAEGRSAWRAFRIAVGAQFAKPLWPKKVKFGYDYPAVDTRARVDLFSPPALVVGADGVPQILWANTARRWVFASRYLRDMCTPAAEIRGPLEQLRGPVLAPRRVGRGAADTRRIRHQNELIRAASGNRGGGIPFAVVTGPRTYIDQLAVAPPEVTTGPGNAGRRIDFLQLDDLAQARGVRVVVEEMRRHAANPVIKTGPAGSVDDFGRPLVRIWHDKQGWHGECVYKTLGKMWRQEQVMHSADGIVWPTCKTYTDQDVYYLDDKPIRKEFKGQFQWIEDADEPDPKRRFKGLHAWDPPWGGKISVVSADGQHWYTVPGSLGLINDGFSQIWKDPDDIPERRYKITAAGRSFCGRVMVMWTSPDALVWKPLRESLDFHDPFGADPYWHEDYQNPAGKAQYGSGQIVVDPWAGPDDEDEIHHGFVFRDGGRWIAMYQKWSPRGHVFPALASSRDGVNFSRVVNGPAGIGVSPIPLGGPGQWDSGRLVPQGAPIEVDGVWRQYYAGSSWHHGMGGSGLRPHPSSEHVGKYSPVQGGLAEIEVGRWVSLRVDADCEEATITTVPLRVEGKWRLWLDVEGVRPPRHELAVEVVGAEGLTFEKCDQVGNGREVAMSWEGKDVIESKPGTVVRVRVRMRGLVRLFGVRVGMV